jgi:DNA-binding response OmpR family regulator
MSIIEISTNLLTLGAFSLYFVSIDNVINTIIIILIFYKMKVLIIEDDIFLAQTIKKALEAHCFNIDITHDGKSGSYIARTNKYKIILLDLILPEKDGVTVCKEIRAEGITTPIIVVSTQSEIPDKITMLKIGADDYITKPFNMEELVVRVKTLTKRPYEILDDIMTLDDLTIDTNTQIVTKDGQNIYLTRREYMLLNCFARNEGRIITRGKILEEVWERDASPFTNTIETHIRNLRKKIESKNKRIIHTVNGRGYRLSRSQ